MPGEHAQQGAPELVFSQNDDETESYDTDETPVLTEEEIAQLQEEDHSHFVDIDDTVFVPLGPKLQDASEFGSYVVTGFNQFEQYLARNDKKQPKAESVITYHARCFEEVC